MSFEISIYILGISSLTDMRLADIFFLVGHLSFNLAAAAAAAKSLQSCPTLCDPMDGSPPGCPVPGILQARTLENESEKCMKVKSESEVAQS